MMVLTEGGVVPFAGSVIIVVEREAVVACAFSVLTVAESDAVVEAAFKQVLTVSVLVIVTVCTPTAGHEVATSAAERVAVAFSLLVFLVFSGAV
jgi:hypothetical protein